MGLRRSNAGRSRARHLPAHHTCPRLQIWRLAFSGSIPSSVFKSNMFPMLLYFQCADGSEYPLIFKDGDDMRQDQLVIQLFTLMDRLLRKENLDLKLSPYDVLATGPSQGMAQFIPSKTIAAIVSEHGTLLNYLRANYPDEGSVGTYGVEPGVIDTFVRSCGEHGLLTCVVVELLTDYVSQLAIAS